MDQRLIDAKAEADAAQEEARKVAQRTAAVADAVGAELLAAAGLKVGDAFVFQPRWTKQPVYARIGKAFRIYSPAKHGLTVDLVRVKKDGERSFSGTLHSKELDWVITEANTPMSVAFRNRLAADTRKAQP